MPPASFQNLLAWLCPSSRIRERAMQDSDLPTKFTLRWAQNAAGADVRNVPMPSQQGIQAGAASFNDGFPPLNFIPPESGGIPPFGQDFNGALRMISAWNQWQQAGGPVTYDADFSTAIGGYPAGAILQQAGVPGAYWISTEDNNASDPDTGGDNWIPFSVANGRLAAMEFEIGDGVNVINANTQGWQEVPFDCSLVRATVLADQTGSIVIDVWKAPYSSYPPTVSNSITGGAPPSISGGIKFQNTTLTGWTTSFSAGDIVKFNVNSASSIAKATLSLVLLRG